MYSHTMIIRDCHFLLEELSQLEDKISQAEQYLVEHDLDIDLEKILRHTFSKRSFEVE